MVPRKLHAPGAAPLRRLVRESIDRAIELAPEGGLVEALAFELGRALRREAAALAGTDGAALAAELEDARGELSDRRARTERELADARDDLDLHRTLLDGAHGAMVRRADADAVALDGELRAGLDELFDHAEQGALPLDDLRARTFALVRRRADAAREAMLAAWDAERDRQVDRLRRRLDKVNRSLAASEAALGRLAAEREADPGVASIYRTVQGLDALTPDAARKRLLLAEIYRANRALRDRRRTSA